MIARSHWQLPGQVHKMARKSDLEQRESECASVEDYLRLVDEAVAEPADPDYARDLLTQAEMQCQFPADYVATAQGHPQGLGDSAYAREWLDQAEEACFEGGEFAAVDRNLHAREWLLRLYSECAGRCEYYSCLQSVAADAAHALSDAELGREIASKIYREHAERLDGEFSATVILAAAVWADLGDVEWTTRLLEKAKTLVQEPLDAATLMQIMERLRRYALPTDQLRSFYGDAGARLTGSRNRLTWAEGIIDFFGDRAWAGEAYDQLQDEFVGDRDRVLFQYSRQHRLNCALTA
jgi:hypothetical protein